MTETDVLIAGAGPTGLVLALWLKAQGVRVRIVDKLAEAGTTSRALAVQARTLELYAQLGLHETVLAHGLKVDTVNMWLAGEHKGAIEVGHVGGDLSPLPHVVIYPQDEHERMLIEELRKRGVEVERPKELTALEEQKDGVIAYLGAERVHAKYVAGCDGAHSKVREIIGSEFPGGTYDHMFYVADVEAMGPVVNGQLHIMLDEEGFLGIFPLAHEGRARVIGTIKVDGDARKYEWSDIDRRPLDLVKLDVQKVNWFSTYHVHHRVAEPFQRGRIFLLGDAAHIHSPVGGQGMNTGIGDAINLAWKLACVVQGRAKPELLDSYSEERIGFAKRLVATTDRVFTGVSSESGVAGVMRQHVIPRIFNLISKRKRGRRFLFERVSQIHIEYPTAKRLRYVRGSGTGQLANYAPLTSVDWQIHVYGKATIEPALERAASARSIPIHRFPHAERDAVDLVRPDGYAVKTDDIAAYLEANDFRARRMTRDSPPTRLTTSLMVAKPWRS